MRKKEQVEHTYNHHDRLRLIESAVEAIISRLYVEQSRTMQDILRGCIRRRLRRYATEKLACVVDHAEAFTLEWIAYGQRRYSRKDILARLFTAVHEDKITAERAVDIASMPTISTCIDAMGAEGISFPDMMPCAVK